MIWRVGICMERSLYNLYFDWITLGKVARTKQYENTTTAFEEPTYDERFESYPAVAYYKMVDAVNPAAVCVAQTIDWYKEGGKNSYDEAFESYPSKAPTGYTLINMCNQYCHAGQEYLESAFNGFLPLLSCFPFTAISMNRMPQL